MVGQEVSFFALSNGGDAIALAAAEDHKCPSATATAVQHGRHGVLFAVAAFDEALEKRVMEAIVRPTLPRSPRGRALPGCPLHRLMRRRRAEGRRVQLPLR